MTVYRGVVRRFGDDVDTDMIIPAERLLAENLGRLGDFVFEKCCPGFADTVRRGDILVAGRNFGCGSSREHAPMALMQAGFSCVIAESFARIFYRNSLNIGLPVIECRLDAADGETAEADTEAGRVRVGGREYSFDGYTGFIAELVEAGGLMNLVREGRF